MRVARDPVQFQYDLMFIKEKPYAPLMSVFPERVSVFKTPATHRGLSVGANVFITTFNNVFRYLH